MKRSHLLLPLVCAALLTGCVSANVSQTSSWRLVFAHDAGGVPIEGSKEALIDAIRSGKPIRLYWRGRTVEHSTPAVFTTILDGEVFAQTADIQGQRPSLDPVSIELRDSRWQGLFATNGKRLLRWYAQH